MCVCVIARYAGIVPVCTFRVLVYRLMVRAPLRSLCRVCLSWPNRRGMIPTLPILPHGMIPTLPIMPPEHRSPSARGAAARSPPSCCRTTWRPTRCGTRRPAQHTLQKPSPDFAPGLPHGMLTRLRDRPLFRTRIHTCCRSLSQRFRGSAAWYVDRGIPYRRGCAVAAALPDSTIRRGPGPHAVLAPQPGTGAGAPGTRELRVRVHTCPRVKSALCVRACACVRACSLAGRYLIYGASGCGKNAPGRAFRTTDSFENFLTRDSDLPCTPVQNSVRFGKRWIRESISMLSVLVRKRCVISYQDHRCCRRDDTTTLCYFVPGSPLNRNGVLRAGPGLRSSLRSRASCASTSVS